MCIDAIETNKTAREVSGKIYKYFPEGFYSNGAEKVVNSAKLRGTAEGIIQKWMDKNMTPTRLRQEFLDETESYFPHYFEETFIAEFVTNASKLQHVKLIFKPPFKVKNLGEIMTLYALQLFISNPPCRKLNRKITSKNTKLVWKWRLSKGNGSTPICKQDYAQ